MASCVLLQEHHSEHVLKNLVELDTSLHISTASGALSVSSTLLQLFREDFKKIDQFKLSPNNIEMFTKRYMYIGGVVMENSKLSIFLNPSLCPIYREILHLRHDIRDPQVTVIIPDIEAWEQLLTQSFVIKIVKPKSKS